MDPHTRQPVTTRRRMMVVALGAKPAKAALQPLVGQLNEVLARG